MSNERKNLGEDQLVTDTYRELANERVPERLNEKILRLAANDIRTRYGIAGAWMRPVAWAATIGLCLAIVLELTRLPQTQLEGLPPVAHSVAPASAPPAPVKRSKPAAPAEGRADRVSMDDFAPQATSVLREAENMARAQAGPDPAPIAVRAEPDELSAEQDLAEENLADNARAVASFAAASEKKELGSDLACDAKVRESAETWFACIESLRKNGPEIVADREYEEFQRIFPDFVESPAGK